jgi:hypothetical protein
MNTWSGVQYASLIAIHKFDEGSTYAKVDGVRRYRTTLVTRIQKRFSLPHLIGLERLLYTSTSDAVRPRLYGPEIVGLGGVPGAFFHHRVNHRLDLTFL